MVGTYFRAAISLGTYGTVVNVRPVWRFSPNFEVKGIIRVPLADLKGLKESTTGPTIQKGYFISYQEAGHVIDKGFDFMFMGISRNEYLVFLQHPWNF